MKVAVAIDNDGHFLVKHIEDREGVLELLHEIHDGDYFADVVRDYNIRFKPDLKQYSPSEWESIIYTFVERGTMEIIKLK